MENIFEWLAANGYLPDSDTQYYTGYREGYRAAPGEFAHALSTANDLITNEADRLVFWQALVDMGAIQGDANYYASGQAQPEEFENAFAVADEAFSSITSDAGSLTVPLGTQAQGSPGEQDVGGGVTTTQAGSEITDAENQQDEGVGLGGEEYTEILTATDMTWHFDEGSGLWYVEYGIPGSDISIIFEATPDQMDALFGIGMRPSVWRSSSLDTLTSDESVFFGGDVGEMQGTGSFEDHLQRVLALATDAGKLPDWAEGDGNFLALLFVAETEGHDENWLIDQVSNLGSFKDRYKGIEHFYALNMDPVTAVDAYLEYETSIMGIAGVDPEDVTPEIISQLLTQQHSVEDVAYVFSIYDRMEKFAPAMEAFNEILGSQGMEPLDEDGIFDFLTGVAPGEVYDLWEASSFLESATAEGLAAIYSPEDAFAAALATPGMAQPTEIRQGFRDAAQLLLRLRTQVDLGRFDLTADDLVDLSLGITPRSGNNPADLEDSITRAVSEATDWINRTQTRPFYGFSQQGVPRATSLSGFRPEA
jgi:hypothetical protein